MSKRAPKLFEDEPAPRPVARTEVQRLMGIWAGMLKAKLGERPFLTPADGAAMKRLVAHAGAETVERRLPAYLALDDDYIAGQGYPLTLMQGAWNRLVAQERRAQPAPGGPMGVDRTQAYIQNLKQVDKL